VLNAETSGRAMCQSDTVGKSKPAQPSSVEQVIDESVMGEYHRQDSDAPNRV